ncbi:hypothetical protein ABIC88_004170 [Pseudomonas kilonensis]
MWEQGLPAIKAMRSFKYRVSCSREQALLPHKTPLPQAFPAVSPCHGNNRSNASSGSGRLCR